MGVVVVDKKPKSANVILELFGKRQGFTHKARTTLPKGVVETLNMVGQSSFFADGMMAFGRKDLGVRLPEIGVENGTLPIGRWQGGPQGLSRRIGAWPNGAANYQACVHVQR